MRKIHLKIAAQIDIEKEGEAEEGKTNFFPYEPGHSNLVWTDSKAALIELIYALKHTGCFNSGKVEIKQITEIFEKIIGEELGNTSKIFQEILSRKSGSTNFLKKLDSKLQEYINSII